MLASSSNSVKDIIRKLERKSSKSVPTSGSIVKLPPKKPPVIPEATTDEVSVVSDISTDCCSASTDEGSQFHYAIGVKSIKNEIEDRIKNSRTHSHKVLPTHYTKICSKLETIPIVYNKGGNESIFGEESPLVSLPMEERKEDRIIVLPKNKNRNVNAMLSPVIEEETRTIVSSNNQLDNRTIITQRAETMTQMYQQESIFGDESPYFIPQQIDDEEYSPNLSERTDKESGRDGDGRREAAIVEDDHRTEISALTMNEQQFKLTQQQMMQERRQRQLASSNHHHQREYQQQQYNKHEIQSISKQTSMTEMSEVSKITENLGTAVIKLLHDAIVKQPPMTATIPASSSSAISIATSPSSLYEKGELMLEDEQDFEKLKMFLREVGCTQSKAIQYSSMLVKNGIPNMEVLKRRLQQNPNYLLIIGFDEFFAHDILEFLVPDSPALIPQQQQQQQQQTEQEQSQLQTTYSTLSSVSLKSKSNNLSGLLSTQSFVTNASSFYVSNNDNHPHNGSSNESFYCDDNSTIKSSPEVSSPKGSGSNGKKLRTTSSSTMRCDVLPSETSSIYYQAVQFSNRDASEKLIDLAETGDIFAQGFIMRMHALGQGMFPKDHKKAQEIARKILPMLKETVRSKLEDHSSFASYLIGVIYSEGLTVDKNTKEAIKWYKQSAKRGYEAAQAYLGFALYSGIGIVTNRVEAVKWYQLAASQGYAPAQTNLGICYEYGEGIKQDYQEAMKWYQLASEQNDSTAQFNLGHCYELGLGVPRDIHKAAEYYTLASELDNAPAQNALACLYSLGDNVNFAQNLTESFRLFKLSADQGYAEAQCKVGLIYENGIGIEPNLTQAVKYYRLSANQGNSAALYYLGYCYFNGLGLSQDYAIAAKLYYKSASKGYPAAQNNLGYCFFVGAGIKKNYAEALKWYRKAADQGYSAAQFNLGYCYEKGYGVTTQLKEMLRWYRLAAANGHAKAMKKLQELKEK